MAIVFVGIDLAKNVFAVHGVDEHGKPALVRSSVARAKLHALICEALQRPNMRFVPVKTLDQQALLTLHRVRQGFIEQRCHFSP